MYSEYARRDIVKVRKIIENIRLPKDEHEIRNARESIILEHPKGIFSSIFNTDEFYSLSMIKDLLFHVQEHRFTLPQISELLVSNKLEFLGFILDESIKNEYSKLYPDDKLNTILTNWHEFETLHPTTFFGMYQFWVKKIAQWSIVYINCL